MGFKQPHGLETGIVGNSSLTLVPKGRSLLPFPCTIGLVMVVQTMVKIPGQSANHRLVTSVGIAQSVGRKPTQVDIRRNHHH